MDGAPAASSPVKTAAAAADAQQQQHRRLNPSELSFETLCRLMAGLRTTNKHAKRRALIYRFIEHNIVKESHDAFSVFRLLLPAQDSERGNYRLLEGKLAQVMLKAANIPRHAAAAKAVREWRSPGAKSAGNFAAVLKHHVLDEACFKVGGEEARALKVGHLNQQLDRLVEEQGNTERQAAIVHHLMTLTTAEQMTWIVQIILKSVKINCSEGTILRAWHKDAEEVFNNSGMNLKFIFNDMVDPAKTFSSTLKPGVAVRPQIASATNNAQWAAEYMRLKHGGRFLLETKFDGERMQVHRYRPSSGDAAVVGEGPAAGHDTIGYFSRKAIEHGGRSNYSVLDDVIRRATKGPCILDGELIVWNKKQQAFAGFGSIKPVIGAVREKKKAGEIIDWNSVDDNAVIKDEEYQDMEVQDCELVYVVFDMLHNGQDAINTEPLSRRLELLRQFVLSGESVPLEGTPVCGRVEVLVPGQTRFAGRLCSYEASTADDIDRAMQQAKELHEEGVMIKALDSHWTPNDRSSRWLKFKPDYLERLEIDAVIIGAWGGEGARGDQYSQYLLGLAQPAGPDGRVRRWVTFCRVGSGLDVDERKQVHDRIAPLCEKAPPEGLYEMTGKEKPDVWIQDPAGSISLEIGADLRTMRTETFATGFSVRFPRIEAIKWDKDGSLANTTLVLEDWIKSERIKHEQRVEQALENLRNPQASKHKRKTGKRDGERAQKRTRVETIAHARLGDLSKVEVESEALAGCKVFISNCDGYNKNDLQAMVRRLGGTPFAIYTPAVTHILAVSDKGRDVAMHRSQDRDVVCVQWLLDCAREGRRLSVPPRHFIHRSRASILADQSVDVMGDSYLSDVEARDMDVLLGRPLRPGQVSVDQLAASLAEQSDFEGGDSKRQALASQERRHSGAATPAAALARYIDAQLASVGTPDPRFRALRGCTFALLRLGRGSARDADIGSSSAGNGAEAEPQQQEGGGSSGDGDAALLFPAVRALMQQGQRTLARLQEAQAATAAAEATVGLDGEPKVQPGPVAPLAVLQAAAVQHGRDGGGVAVASLHAGLVSGSMHLVTGSWVHRCLERAEAGIAGLPPDDGIVLAATDPDSLQQWPWECFPADPAPSPHRAAAAAHAPAGTAVGGCPLRARRGTATARAPVRRSPASKGALPAAGEEVKQESDGSMKQEPGSNGGEQGQAAAGPARRAGGFRRRGTATKLSGGSRAKRAAPAAAEPAAAVGAGLAGIPADAQAEAEAGGGGKEEPAEAAGGWSWQQQEQALAPGPAPPAPVPPAMQTVPVPSIFDALFSGELASLGPPPAASAPSAPQPSAASPEPAPLPAALPEAPAAAGMVASQPAAAPAAGAAPALAAPAFLSLQPWEVSQPGAATDGVGAVGFASGEPPGTSGEGGQGAAGGGVRPKLSLRERMARLKKA